MTLAIETHDLRKVYAVDGYRVEALRGVTLHVAPGTLFGLFGNNGAGKTTLIRLLTTLLEPSAGRAWVNGFDVQREAQQVRASIGLCSSEDRSFYARLTARQNLMFYGALQDLPWRSLQRRIDELLQLFDLQRAADAPVQVFSTGMRQKLNVARALLHDPPLVFLDEPTKSLDVTAADQLRDLIRHELVGHQHKTVFYTTHELYGMETFCDRVAVIRNGEIYLEGTPGDVLNALPGISTYLLEVATEEPQLLGARLAALPGVQTLQAQTGETAGLGTWEITLGPDETQVWPAIWQEVLAHGGQLRRCEQQRRRSLRDVVKEVASGEGRAHVP